MLRIRPRAVAAIGDHARRGEPNEVVGLLAADPAGSLVEAAELGEGAPDSVVLSRAAADAAARVLERRGLSRGATYHSHVARPPRPTEADRLAMTAGEPMLIVCARTLELRAFALAADGIHVHELELAVER